MSAQPIEAFVVSQPAIRPLLTPTVKLPAKLQMELRMHRECAPEHAGIVRSMCMDDTSVLPRYHQEDRGEDDEHRGVHFQVPEGAYSRITAWSGRDHWVAFVIPQVIHRYRDLMAKHRVAPETLREWAKVKSGYVKDAASGRRCIVRPKQLASVLGITERHVQNINAFAREIGLEVVVFAGRMLTQGERWHCYKNGSRQRGLAAEVALTVPRFLTLVVEEFTPHRGPRFFNSPHPFLNHFNGLAAEKKDAAPPRPPEKRARRGHAARKLAADLIPLMPWLASERPGNLAPCLTRFATSTTPWSAVDVVHAVTAHSLRTGRGAIEAESIRTRPAALLASILRELDPQADHPNLDPFSPSPSPSPRLTVVPASEPCGSPDCDHGWIEVTDPAADDTVEIDGVLVRFVGAKRPRSRFAPCPSCAPSVRRSEADLTPPTNPNFEPPF